jgi:hypothetical protein
MGLIAMMMMMFLAIIPIIGQILSNVLSVIIVSGFYLACAKAHREEEVEVGDLFLGFSHRPGALVGALAIYLAVVMVGVFIILGAAMGLKLDPPIVGVIGFSVAVFFIIPAAMAYTFAPILLTLHDDLGIIDSMKLSFFGCLKNIPAFIVWMILVIFLMIASIFTLFLGLVVLIPVMMIGMYYAYRDIFLEQ